MSKRRITIITLASSVTNMLLVAVFGLIYNQKILQVYGSSVNGLISTLTQFVSMFVVLEGGFSTAALVAVYQPIVDKDYIQLNNILLTIKKYLNKLGIVIFFLAFVFGIVYLFFIDSPLTWIQTITLLFVTAFTTSFSIAVQSKYNVALNGFNKQYILNSCSILTKTLCWIISVVLILHKKNIVLIYAIYTSNIVLSCIVFHFFIKKNIPEISFKGIYDKKLINGTNDVFVQKVASTVFTSTDLVLISAGVGLANASVYNVYHQIFNMMNALQSSVSESPFNSFGHLLNEDKKKFYELFNHYTILFVISTTAILASLGSVIVDFVHLYTHGVNDINYIVPFVALLFYSQYFFTICNKPFGLLLNLEKKFREQNFQCVLGAFLNLICSIVGMHIWGIEGIILGSVVGAATIMTFNFIKCINHKFLQKPTQIGAIITLNFIIGFLCIVFRLFSFELYSDTYVEWFYSSFVNFLVVSALVVAFDFMIMKKDMLNVVKFFKSFVLRK